MKRTLIKSIKYVCRTPIFFPVEPNLHIWRFMDYAKFCSLLDKQALFFTRLSQFTNDPWEGRYPKKHADPVAYGNGVHESAVQTIIRSNKTLVELAREKIAANCWFISEDESEAFWRIHPSRSVAIVSTGKRLQDAFLQCHDRNVYIGKVQYLNYEEDVIDPTNLFNLAVHKRLHYQYENELRAVVWEDLNIDGSGSKLFDSKVGTYIDIDLNKLIERVIIGPSEGSWFCDLVASTCHRYNLNITPSKSQLYEFVN